MKTLFYFLVLVFLLFNSCDRNKRHQIKLESNIDTKIVKFDDISPTTIQASSILDSLEFIILNSDKAGFIYDIDKVILHNNEIYVLDSRQHMILVFDSEGTFLRKIAKLGRGPGEYPFLSDFTLQNNTILILNRDIVYKYDLLGNFIESITLDFIPSNIESSNKFYYFFRRGNVHFNDEKYYYDLIKCDTEGNIINMYFPYGKDTYKISTKSPFYRNGEELYYINGGEPDVAHTVYSLVDEHDHPVPKYDIKRNSSHPFVIGDFFVTENTMIFNVICQKNSGKVVISKLDSTVVIYNKVIADSKFLFAGNSVEFSYDSYFLTKIEASEMGMIMNDNEQFESLLMKEYPHYEAFFEHIKSENINPVLIKEYYKTRLVK